MIPAIQASHFIYLFIMTMVSALGQSRPDLFKHEHIETHFSLQNYHVMGSRILSRSFLVEKWEDDEDEGEDDPEEIADQSGMEVDSNHAETKEEGATSELEEPDDEDDEDAEDQSDVAMVPMADMLNARYGAENVRRDFCYYDLITKSTLDIGETVL